MKKNSKRIISLLLGLVMFLTMAPAVFAQNESGTVLPDKDQLVSDLTKEDHAFSELEAVMREVSDIDLSKLNLLESSVKMEDGKVDKKASKSEEEQYVEDVAAAFKNPVGAVDIKTSDDLAVYVVWLQQLPTALSNYYGKTRADALSRDYSQLGAQARKTIKTTFKSKIVWEYTSVFSGFAVEMTGRQANELAKMPGVYAVTPDTVMTADAAVSTLKSGAGSATRSPIKSAVSRESLGSVSRLGSSSEIGFDPTYGVEGMKESREILGIGEIHASGITGSGVVVGVLDTGIDFNHPDLKDSFKGGWNYITSGADYARPEELKESPMETTYEQWLASGRAEENSSGNSFYTSHGTHVSGTVAAQGKNNEDSNYKALGMAPGAELYVARVLGPYGSGATTGIIAAVEDFSTGNSDRGIPKADVINLSLGADNNNAYGSDVFALNNAVLAGVNVAVSAGNNAGSDMNGRKTATLGSPGTAYLPVTVAAAQYGGTSVKTYDEVKANVNGAASDVSFRLLIEGQQVSNTFSDNLITGNPAPVYVDGKGYEAYLAFGPNDTNPTLEQLKAIPDGSLAGKVLFVKRGINFTDYQEQALRTGAGAVVIVNSAANGEVFITNMVIGGTAVNSLPIFSAYHSTSAKLTALAEGGNTVYVELGNLNLADQEKLPAYFSSIGPVNPTIGLKPDIIAPGWSIVSSAPAFITTADHSSDDYSAAYQSMSGTSMSSPHMCGILALMKQKYPNAEPAELKARLMNTAKPQEINALADGTPASVLEVGAGFVDPARAILEDTAVYVTVQDDIPGKSSGDVIKDMTLSSLSFGAAETGGSSRKLTVTVHGASDFSVSAAYNDVTRYSNDATANGVELKYDAAENGSFDVWIEAPEAAANGFYEGWLKVTAGDKEYSLPWLVQVGEGTSGIDFDVLATAERPIISTSKDPKVRSAGGEEPVSSNSTSLYFAYEGSDGWPEDGSGERPLDLYLISDKGGSLSLAYLYEYYINMPAGPGDFDDVFVIPNFITDRAHPIVGNYLRPATTIANGTYYLGIGAGDDVYYHPLLGIVFTDGVGEMAVQLDVDEPDFMSMDPDDDMINITGRIYSPALAKADAAGLIWTEVEDFWLYDEYFLIDQSLNVLGVDTEDDIYVDYLLGYIFGNNIIFDEEGYLFPCDEDGYFDLTFAVSEEQKLAGALFDTKIVGVEGLYFNDDNSSSYWYYLVGANKSAPVSVDIFAPHVSSVVATNGSLTMEFAGLPAGVVVSEDDLDITSVLVPEDVDIVLEDFSYDPLTLTATYSFEPVAAKDWVQTLSFNVEYNRTSLDSNVVEIEGKIDGPIEIIYYNAGLVSVGKNRKVTLEILTDPVVDLSEYEISWTSAQPSIATVSKNGVVTGKKVGNAIVTATIINPYGEVASLDFNIRVY